MVTDDIVVPLIGKTCSVQLSFEERFLKLRESSSAVGAVDCAERVGNAVWRPTRLSGMHWAFLVESGGC